MPKMIINLRAGVDQENFKNGDLLLYDATTGEFYITTAETFFDKANSRINELIKKYDKDVADCRKEKEEMKEELKTIKAENAEFKRQIKENNTELIEMVENFIKGGSK